MGKGYKRKTRWRTLNIGAPPGEEDEEDGIRNGYGKGQENGVSSRNGQAGHKTGRTDSAGSTTSDYASDYASAASRSRRDDSGGSPSQPKIIFNENEYTRITTPRQDVLFKKGYLSRKKVWASTASTSATPSTTESQSASHSTADGSETTEDQQLLDCKENGAEEYPGMVEPGGQVAYGTFYDHSSGYYYEYPVMVVGPGAGMPGPAMHNVLTAVPCGPVPLRPIEWVNPAFVPKLGNQQYCVMDYQSTHLAQYPTLVDENNVPLTTPLENTYESEEACHENGIDTTASWADVVDEEDPASAPTTETQNGTTETSAEPAVEDEAAEEPVDSENYLENALAQQLHVTHVAVPPVPQPYMYPGHYMFGPSLVNVNVSIGGRAAGKGFAHVHECCPVHRHHCCFVATVPLPRSSKKTPVVKHDRPMLSQPQVNPVAFHVLPGVTIQCGPMVRNTGVTGAPTNTGACAKRRKKKKLSKRKSRRPPGPGNAEDEEQEEEDYSSEAENGTGLPQIAGVSEVASAGVVAGESGSGEAVVAPISHRPLNPECREFRPVHARSPRASVDGTSGETASNQSNCEPSSSADSSDKHQNDLASESVEKSIPPPSLGSTEVNSQDSAISRIPESAVVTTNVESTEKLVTRSEEEVEAAPVEFAAEVFANVTNMAERALEPRNVVEGTPMETEIGLDATSVDFKDIVENLDAPKQPEETIRNRRRIESVEEEVVPNGQATVDEENSREQTNATDGGSQVQPDVTATISGNRQRGSGRNDQRGSRSASPGMINRTTTPINAMTQRLPESYESLVTRGSNASSSSSLSAVAAPQAVRNRKYSTKVSKFAREATPGPDLDGVQQQQQQQQQQSPPRTSIELEDLSRMRNKVENGTNSEPIVINTETATRATFENDNEAIATGIDAIEAEVQRFSLSTNGSFYADSNGANKRDTSNDDSGVESQTRFSSDHPITDAVTEWLQRANSPELFVTSTVVSDCEPEDDELEEEEPPKNLQGNPMPALSANSSVNDSGSSRLASCGEFARIINVNSTETARNERNIKNHNNNINNNNNDDSEKKISGESLTSSVIPTRRKRRAEAKRRGSKKSALATNIDSSAVQQQAEKKSVSASPSSDANEEAARQRVGNSCQLADNRRIVADDICEFTEKDSDAGVRVAKSSRTKKNKMMMDSCKSRVDKSRRQTNAHDTSTVIMLSSRDVPVENVEVKVRRLTDDNDEGIVEDEEVSVRTFEKGEIVVSIKGKVLPVAAYEPVLLQHQQREECSTLSCVEDCEKPQFTKITCEKSRCDEETSTVSENSASKRNSLGSIEEPDVLECWEVETVEPITTPKRQARGTSQEGETDEGEAAAIDPAAVEIVRKYYRLEAMRDSGASVTSVEDEELAEERTRTNSLPTSPERMIESLCSEEIPVIGERLSKIVEKMLNDSGIPVEEGVEVYESCYTGKPPSYLIGFDKKFRRNGTFFGRQNERDGGVVPCKAACCNIQ